MEEETTYCDVLQRQFRGQGWNLAGANLLTASCWLADTFFLYLRPTLLTSDLVLVGIMCGLGALTPASAIIGSLVGLVIGGMYLLWKLGQWQPATEMIKSRLNRNQQKELVHKLVDLCQQNSIDPECLDALISSVSKEGDLKLRFHDSIMNFFKQTLQMQE